MLREEIARFEQMERRLAELETKVRKLMADCQPWSIENGGFRLSLEPGKQHDQSIVWTGFIQFANYTLDTFVSTNGEDVYQRMKGKLVQYIGSLRELMQQLTTKGE